MGTWGGLVLAAGLATTPAPAATAAFEATSPGHVVQATLSVDEGGVVRYGVRLRDRNSAMRREFKGLRWHPVDPAYRVVAQFVAYPEPKTIPVPNILGDTPEMTSPGYVEFTLAGQALRLEPVFDGADAHELFFIFGDQTNGLETYPSGRFLYAALPESGQVVLDFNKAENPPCAFTPFATCPLPPKQNRLPVRVEAGELSYGHH